MGRIRFRIHPLFFAFGFYYALTGRIFVFIIYTLTALIHELGHSFVSQGLGYRLNNITLMPYGAVVTGNIDGLKLIDEIKIALAGPFLNLAIALFFIATWWIFPEGYTFTDTAVTANLSVAIINFIPAYPLDGGRVLSGALSLAIGKKKARVVCYVLGLGLGTGLFALFVCSAFYTLNLSLLFFSAFVFFGALDRKKENVYVSVYSALSEENLKRGLPYKKQALDKSVSIKKLISVLESNCVNEIVVFSDGKEAAVLKQNRILEIINNASIYEKLEKFI